MMSDDWKPGDLALCVRTPRLGNGEVVKGRFYDVVRVIRGVRWMGGACGPALTLAGVRHENPCGGCWSGNFRKINPLNEAEHAAAMRELNAPVKGPAHV
jgi:hypothetical protein